MIYVLMGPEDFLRDVRLAELRSAIPEAERETSIVDLPAAGLTPDILVAQAHALPFFATQRLVIVRGLMSRSGKGAEKTDRGTWDAYAQALSGAPETTTVALVETNLVAESHPLLKRKAPTWRIERFETLKEAALGDWIKRRVKSRGGKIAPEAAHLLAKAAGGNLRQIDNELSKLLIYAADRPIERPDVIELVQDAGHESIFALADALFAGDSRRALHLYHQLMADGTTDVHQLLAILSGQIRNALHVRRQQQLGRPLPDLIPALSLSPNFRLDLVVRKTARLSPETLARAYEELLALDWAAKTGRGELETGLDVFIAGGALAGR